MIGEIFEMSELTKQQPKVSIITVNFNQSGVTMDLCESLRKITYDKIEIVVVDNGSQNDNPKVIKEKYPEIILIETGENLGFAGGNNAGISKASGDYFLFLNNDTEVEAGFLEPLVEMMEEDESIGMICPKIRFHHTPDTIQFAGYTPMNPYTVQNHLIGYRQVDTGQHDQIRETNFGHGAAMMVSRKVAEEVGLMADIFFLYYEELDWGHRIRKAGYKIMFNYQSLVYHKESISTGKMSPLKIHYINRNRIVFMRRNYSGLKFFAGFLFQTFAAFPKNLLMFLIKGQFKLAGAFLKAYTWNMKNVFNKDIHFNPKLK